MHGVTTVPSNHCLRCHYENPPGAKFCEECGSPFARNCANCGAVLPPTAKFCADCGAAAGGAVTPQPAKPSADENLGNATVLDGELKLITVMFADMKGSLEAIAHSDPEQVTAILDPVVVQMKEAVHRYGGTVNRVMGDGIMALFGAPLSLEDHAMGACYAALAMQASIAGHREEARRKYGVEVQIRVGINSGDTLVRTIEHDVSREYAAVGVTTHLAARMEQLALPGTIRITAETLKLAEGYIEVKSLGPVPIKGLPDPVEVYELIGTGKAHTRLQAAAVRGLTKFAGRSAELTQMFTALEQAHAGHGQIVALVGEPGVGKSRLAWEFIHSHRSQGFLILESASVSHGKASAYRPVIELLKTYFQIEDRDDGRRVREKLTGKLLALEETFRPHLVPLLALLDVPIDDDKWNPLDPVQKRMRTLDACKRLILREAQVQPLVLVFEDLHWIDGESQALLDGLVESLPTVQLLLLVNFRPEYPPRWSNKTYYTQLRIDPLAGESAEELLRTLLGTDPSIQPLAELLIERTEGNPLYLEESVRALVETSALEGERGAYRLTAPLTSILVPATVQAILAARIDRLAAEDKHLLQAAAVIGKDVPYTLLQAIVELPEEVLRQRLGTLQAAEFLYEKSLFPNLEYTFKHALTHEVAYGSVLQARRKALHARIMASIERLYADRLAEQVERLAHHALRGEMWDKAVIYFRQAGEKAIGRSANHEALAHFDQARVALQEWPASRERTEQLIDLCFEKRSALWPLGEFARQSEVLYEARALAAELGDERRLGLVLGYQANIYTLLGEHALGIDAAHGACAIAEAVRDLGLRIVANFYLGRALWWSGDPRRAVEPLRAAIALVNEAPPGERFGLAALAAVAVRFELAVVLAEMGEFAEGVAAGKDGLLMAQAAGHPYSEVWARYGLGYAHLRHGDFAAATGVLEQGLALCRGMQIRFAVPFAAASLGSAYLWSGRAAGAVSLLEEAVKAITAMRMLGVRSVFITFLAEAYLALGRIAEAREQVEQALALARDHPERSWEALGLKLLGDVHAYDPAEVEQAGDAYRRALALAAEQGMRPLVAHCHFGLFALARKTGHGEQAQEHLTISTAMYRDMDMRFWVEKAEVEMRALVSKR